jgi:hypothetical protein
MLTFPALGDEYLLQLIEHFARVHRGRKPKLDDMRRLFEQIGFKPALMKDLVKAMSAEGITDTDLALKHFVSDERQLSGWRALLRSFDPLDRRVLLMIAQGHPPMGRETLSLLVRRKEAPATVAKVRASIERLKRAGVLAKSSAGATVIEDRLLSNYLAGLRLEELD